MHHVGAELTQCAAEPRVHARVKAAALPQVRNGDAPLRQHRLEPALEGIVE